MSGIDKLAQRIAAERFCVNCRHCVAAEWPINLIAKTICTHPELASRVDGSAVSCSEQRESRSAQACGWEGRLFVERVGDSAEFGCQPLQAESNQKV